MKNNCEDCKHYQFIDSGYGRCVKNPPQVHIVRKSAFNWENKVSYPVIPWDMRICSYYEEDGQGK